MKSNNLWRVIWIVGIYAVLCSILYLVIIYKVKWENKDLNKYLYFYDCNSQLCTSDITRNDFYSKVICSDDICPFIDNINGELLILNDGNNSYLYDYLNGKVINNKYLEYRYLNDNYYSVKNEDNLWGVIDNEGKLVVNFQEYEIINYDNNNLVYKNSNEKYQIKKMDTGMNINIEYDMVKLINDNLYAYMSDNNYYIASYNSLSPVNNVIYEYLEVFDNVILTISNKKIDILNFDLKSTLVMTIPTYYEYREEKERDSLNSFVLNDILFFDVINEENKYISYRYDIRNRKLYD